MTSKTPTTPESRRAQGVYAVRVRELGPDHPDTAVAREHWQHERWLAAVTAAVDNAPPLTPEIRVRVRQILAPVTGIVGNVAVSA